VIDILDVLSGTDFEKNEWIIVGGFAELAQLYAS
jgi:hypothetical protein